MVACALVTTKCEEVIPANVTVAGKKGPFDGKVRRFFTSLVLPVDKRREGECLRCGACCKFLFKCPFLKSDDGEPGIYSCKAYIVRPPQCRKYPRSKEEQIHQPCGYSFKD